MPCRRRPRPTAERSTVARGRRPARSPHLLRGSREDPLGHRLSLSTWRDRVERYWAAPFRGARSRAAREGSAERLRTEVFAAVDRAAAGARLPAVRLSGGLDSACVAAGLLAASVGGRPALALSVVLSGPSGDRRAEPDRGRRSQARTRLGAGQLRRALLGPRAGTRHVERWRLPAGQPQPLSLGAADGASPRARRRRNARRRGRRRALRVRALPDRAIRCAAAGPARLELCGRIPGIGKEPARACGCGRCGVFGARWLLSWVPRAPLAPPPRAAAKTRIRLLTARPVWSIWPSSGAEVRLARARRAALVARSGRRPDRRRRCSSTSPASYAASRRRRHRPPAPAALRPRPGLRGAQPARRGSVRSGPRPLAAARRPRRSTSPSRFVAATAKAASPRCCPRRSAGGTGCAARRPRRARRRRFAPSSRARPWIDCSLGAVPAGGGQMSSGGSRMVDPWLRSRRG